MKLLTSVVVGALSHPKPIGSDAPDPMPADKEAGSVNEINSINVNFAPKNINQQNFIDIDNDIDFDFDFNIGAAAKILR